jgi:hypothetical protein
MKSIKIIDVPLVVDEAVDASTDGTTDITEEFNKVEWVAAPVIFLDAVEDTNGSTFDVDIQVSLDGGTNKEEVLSFTQLSATGHELKAFTIPPFGGKIYVVTTVSAGGGAFTYSLTLAGPVNGGRGPKY